MKKLLSVILALVMILSLSTVAFADTTEEPTTDMEKVTLTKVYKLANEGTTSPAEAFEFTDMTFVSATDTGVEYNDEAAKTKLPTIGKAEYAAGAATIAGTKVSVDITLPTYDAVGVYNYTFVEKNNGTAGVEYHTNLIKLKVTVVDVDGIKRVAAVHTEEEGGQKSNEFENTYSAGSLSVKKIVTGNMGDKQKDFDVTVTFKAPADKTVKEEIKYTVGTEEKSITDSDWNNNTASVQITLKHDQTITFTNIPYGVTYTVVEDKYSDYETTYVGDNGTIGAPSAEATITNNKGATVDTGIVLDSMPYVLLLAVAAMGLAVLLTKKRASRED